MTTKKRTVNDFHIEFSETAQKLGLLEYQLAVEIPEEIEKLRIKMHNLALEGKKYRDAEDLAMRQARESGTKIDLPPEVQQAIDTAAGEPEPQPVSN